MLSMEQTSRCRRFKHAEKSGYTAVPAVVKHWHYKLVERNEIGESMTQRPASGRNSDGNSAIHSELWTAWHVWTLRLWTSSNTALPQHTKLRQDLLPHTFASGAIAAYLRNSGRIFWQPATCKRHVLQKLRSRSPTTLGVILWQFLMSILQDVPVPG